MPSCSYGDNDPLEAPTKPKSGRGRLITLEQEEYDALMSELPTLEVEPPPTIKNQKLNEKIKKIEFCMMIIVGLLLVVLVLSKVK